MHRGLRFQGNVRKALGAPFCTCGCMQGLYGKGIETYGVPGSGF